MSFFTRHKPTRTAKEVAILEPIPFGLEDSANGVTDPTDPDFLPFILKDEEGHIIGGHYVTEDAYTNLLIAMHDGVADIEAFLRICSLSTRSVEKGNIILRSKSFEVMRKNGNGDKVAVPVTVRLLQVPLGLSFCDNKGTGWKIIERLETMNLLQKGAMALSWLLHRVQETENKDEKLALVRTRFNRYTSNGMFEVSISTLPVSHSDAFMYKAKNDENKGGGDGEVVEQGQEEDTGW